jgi:hypothetical protein
MTLFRLIPLHVHGAFEVVLALAVMLAPFLFGFEPAALVVSVVLGALIFGVAIATHASDERALPISTHAAFDIAFALVMAVVAVVFGLTDERAAAAVFGGASVLVVLLTSVTRYSPSHA